VSVSPRALEIADAVRSGARTARSFAEAAIAEVDRGEPSLHCMNATTPDRALAAADAVDAIVADGGDPGPLAGVPIAVKDNLCTLGVATTCSSRILEGWIPPYDATVVRRIIDAGAVIVGKTNLDEFAMGSSTENSAFGPTRNPWDTGRVPGGSSGGSAAIVASGAVPLSLGSDTGGSIRQPASFCGVVGVKPTYGLVSRYGLVAFASSLDQVGPFAGSVADAGLLLETIAGHDPCDSTSLDVPVPELSRAIAEGVSELRIGVISDFLDGASPRTRSAVGEAVAALGAAGADVAEVSIPELLDGLAAYYLLAPAEASSNLSRYDGVRYGLRVDGDDVAQMNARTRGQGFGDEVKRRIMLGTYVLSAGYYDAYYSQAQRVRTLVVRAFERAYGEFDALIAPVTPSVAFAFGEKTLDPYEMYLSDLYTIPSNLAGHPAISVPFALGEHEMPIGVQVLAPALGEETMFSVAAVLEAAQHSGSAAPLGLSLRGAV
jgi:aspartyl-tRNA(Asn)/glutamyl-tRNA(Gln) amidotransferase subunit A